MAKTPDKQDDFSTCAAHGLAAGATESGELHYQPKVILPPIHVRERLEALLSVYGDGIGLKKGLAYINQRKWWQRVFKCGFGFTPNLLCVYRFEYTELKTFEELYSHKLQFPNLATCVLGIRDPDEEWGNGGHCVCALEADVDGAGRKFIVCKNSQSLRTKKGGAEQAYRNMYKHQFGGEALVLRLVIEAVLCDECFRKDSFEKSKKAAKKKCKHTVPVESQRYLNYLKRKPEGEAAAVAAEPGGKLAQSKKKAGPKSTLVKNVKSMKEKKKIGPKKRITKNTKSPTPKKKGKAGASRSPTPKKKGKAGASRSKMQKMEANISKYSPKDKTKIYEYLGDVFVGQTGRKGICGEWGPLCKHTLYKCRHTHRADGVVVVHPQQ